MIPKDSTSSPTVIQDRDHLFTLSEGGHDGGAKDVTREQDDRILILVPSPEGRQSRLEPGRTSCWLLLRIKLE